MFNYYGSKSKIAHKYPPPQYDTIIEPFAGAAWYSVLYPNKNVILNEKYDVIYNIWKWLIQEAKPKDFLDLRNRFYLKQNINELNLKPKELRDIAGFLIARGANPKTNIVQKFGISSINYRLYHIAKMIPKIRHWRIHFGDYKEIPNQEAVWFIDPPYKVGGEIYKESNKNINYTELAKWCRSRKGQVIVCENQNNGGWMNFRPLVKIRGLRKKNTECIWTNTKTKNIQYYLK